MQSKNVAYIEKLDHLRFFAAFMVIEFHTEIWMRGSGAPADVLPIPLFHQGYLGVGLFMVISGLILAAISHDKDIDIRRFYLNRVLRIYPLFVFMVALGYFSTPDPRPTSVGIDFLSALLPISNLYRLQYGPYAAVMFSIALELQFYLLFPFLLMFSRRYGRWYYFALVAFLIVVRASVYLLTGTAHHLGYFSIFGALDTFLVGVIAGGLYVGMGKRQFSGWLVVLAFVALNAFVYLIHAQPSFFHFDFSGATQDQVSRNPLWIVWPTIEGVVFAAFALLYLRSSLHLPFSGLFAWLGKISYSLYGWHTLVCLLAVKLHIHFVPAYVLGILVILPVTVFLSWMSYNLIEKPFLDLRVKYTRPLTAAKELQQA